MDDAMRGVFVRGPRWSTGTSLVQGSMASQSHRTCLALRNLGARLVQLQLRKVEVTEAVLMQSLCMCASTSQKGSCWSLDGSRRPARRRMRPVLQPAQTVLWQSVEMGFS